MPINNEEIVKLVTELSRAEDLKVTVTESAKAGLIVGSTTFAGGVIGGPVGMAVGGMFGIFMSLARGKGKYRSAVDVILFDMTPAQHQQLGDSIQRIVSDLRVEDFTVLLPLVMSNAGIKELVLKEIVMFFHNEMRMQIAR